jgi:hypothetical protein
METGTKSRQRRDDGLENGEGFLEREQKSRSWVWEVSKSSRSG